MQAPRPRISGGSCSALRNATTASGSSSGTAGGARPSSTDASRPRGRRVHDIDLVSGKPGTVQGEPFSATAPRKGGVLPVRFDSVAPKVDASRAGGALVHLFDDLERGKAGAGATLISVLRAFLVLHWRVE